jgi:thymidylate kinase
MVFQPKSAAGFPNDFPFDFRYNLDYNQFMIKISFSGIPGCGKTALLNEVKKILSLKYKVDIIDEINRKNPFDEDQKASFVSQFFYISTQINEENRKSINTLDYLLCDRSILDQWIYWRNYIAEKEMTPQLQERNHVLKTIYQFWVKTYDLIFFIKTNTLELKKREFTSELRATDANYMKKTEESFKKILKEDNLNVIEIWNNSTIDECAHKIIESIPNF